MAHRPHYRRLLNKDIFAVALRQARQKAKLTQSQLGDIVLLSQRSISKLENGRTQYIHRQTLRDLDRFFGRLPGASYRRSKLGSEKL